MIKVGDYAKVITKKYGNTWYNRVGIVTKIYKFNSDVQVTFIDKIGAFLPRELKKATKQEYFLDVL